MTRIDAQEPECVLAGGEEGGDVVSLIADVICAHCPGADPAQIYRGGLAVDLQSCSQTKREP